MNHLMLDIETIGKRENSIILSIAAVIFDPSVAKPVTDINYPKFVRYFDFREQKGYRETDPETVEWWKAQDEEVILKNFSGTQLLEDGLLEFVDWCSDYEVVNYWCRGIDFDYVILKHAMKQLDIPCDFMAKFWLLADERTAGTIMGLLVDNPWAYKNAKKNILKKINMPAHDPLADVIAQAKMVEIFVSGLKEGKLLEETL